MDSVCLAECPREHTLRRVALRRNGTVLLSSLTYARSPMTADSRLFDLKSNRSQPQLPTSSHQATTFPAVSAGIPASLLIVSRNLIPQSSPLLKASMTDLVGYAR